MNPYLRRAIWAVEDLFSKPDWQKRLYSCVTDEGYKLIKHCVSKGASVNADYMGFLPLNIAAENQSTGPFDTLLELGADPKQVDKYGRNALHWAVKRSNIHAVCLVYNNCDPQAQDSHGETIFDIHKSVMQNTTDANRLRAWLVNDFLDKRSGGSTTPAFADKTVGIDFDRAAIVSTPSGNDETITVTGNRRKHKLSLG